MERSEERATPDYSGVSKIRKASGYADSGLVLPRNWLKRMSKAMGGLVGNGMSLLIRGWVGWDVTMKDGSPSSKKESEIGRAHV